MLGFNGGLIGATRTTTGQASVPGIWTPREQLRARRESLWPVVVTYVDPYASSVSLYLKGDGPNASTTFIDSSPAPKTVTAVGNAQISTAQSKSGGASMLFDGSGDYVEVSSNTAFEFGTGDFTIELWFYMSTLPATFALFSGCAGRNFYFGIGTYSGNRYLISYDGSAELNQVSGTSITAGTWYHAAHCRSGGTARLFLNGNEVRSGSFGSITGTTGYQVGASPFYAQYYFNGYIDDFRITKGVARYTSNFTPPGAL